MKTGHFTVLGIADPIHVLWFSARERQILRLVRTGISSKEMATALCVSDDTVRGHVADARPPDRRRLLAAAGPLVARGVDAFRARAL
jgi:FixJ family two-component response regulator